MQTEGSLPDKGTYFGPENYESGGEEDVASSCYARASELDCFSGKVG